MSTHPAVPAPAPTSGSPDPTGALPANRQPDAGVDATFIGRWSRRAFADRPVSPSELATLFEAARWAPSCFNDQPWLFVYGSQPDDLARLRPLLNDKNQRWAARAPALAFLFTRKRFAHNGAPNRWAELDAGAAWMSVALQAHGLGLTTHAMAGVHADRVHAAMGVPEADYTFLCAIAIGWPADPDGLPDDLRAREQPSARKALAEVAHEGSFHPPAEDSP